MKLSKHFISEEWICKCGCGQCIVNGNLLKMAEAFRERVKKWMIVHCVNRCPEHNENVGGVKNSKHVKGEAMDFHVRKMPMKELHTIALSSEDILTGGVGIYDWGVHIDVGTKRIWDHRDG